MRPINDIGARSWRKVLADVLDDPVLDKNVAVGLGADTAVHGYDGGVFDQVRSHDVWYVGVGCFEE